jgi:hypothetical protein
LIEILIKKNFISIRFRKLKDQHFEEFHAKQMCECGLEFEKSLIENHKVS